MALSLRKLLDAVLGTVIFCAVLIGDAQSLPDSIPDDFEFNCAAQREIDGTLCCSLRLEERFFCPIQCLGDGMCRCVNTATAENLVGIRPFLESEINSFNCTPTTAPPTTAETSTTPETTDPATDAPMTADPTTNSPTTAAPATDSPTTADPATDSPTTAAPATDSPTNANPAATDSPTTADPDSPTNADPTTNSPMTAAPDSPTTADPDSPTNADPTTNSPTTAAPDSPTNADPTTNSPTTAAPATDSPTTADPTTNSPTTAAPAPDSSTTAAPTTDPDYSCDESGSRSRSSRSRRGSKSKSKGSRSSNRNTGEESSRSNSRSGYDCSDRSRSRSSRSRSSRSRSSRGSTRSGTGTGRGRKCKTVQQMQRSGCADTCLEFDANGCPVCGLECNREGINSRCDCQASQRCIRMGYFGLLHCVDRPGEGEMCGMEEDADESEDEISRSASRESTGRRRKRRVRRRKIRGATERLLFGNVEEADIECQDGSTCVETTDSTMECRPEDADSNCVQAQRRSLSITCTPDGLFKTLQCHTRKGKMICRCVHPSDGTRLPGTREMTITSNDDIPNCDVLVFRNCTMKVGDVMFGVAHQDYMVDRTLCRRCLCNNGQLEDCDPSQTCASIQSNPKACAYKGQTIAHGEHIDVDCNKCSCYNGHLSCTHQRCKDRPLRDRCSTCGRRRVSPVCGPNGATYHTHCHAVYCAGQLPVRLMNGACHKQNMCSRYPCKKGETCVRKGGTICIGKCKAEDFRTCVDVSKLTCQSDQEMSGTKLCATNGETYGSLCRLLQDTKNERVAYVGECGSADCSGGEVCGADMVTYDNICEHRSTSNARFDYSGKCLGMGKGNSVDEICGLVSARNVCRYNPTNCKRLVEPRGGCCAICGGVLLIAIDLRGLREYFKINPLLGNFDSLYEILAGSEIFTSETTKRCDVEITLADRNLEIILSVKTLDDQDFCSSESERITELFNNPSEYISFIPDALQFSRAAVSLDPTQFVEDHRNGAMPVAATIVIYIVMAAIAVLQ